MRKPLGVLVAVVGLAACSPFTGDAQGGPSPAPSASADEATPTFAPSPRTSPRTSAESDRCRVGVTRPAITSLTIQTSAVRRDCVHPALLRVRIKRAVRGEDLVVKSGATRKDRITLNLPCEPGTYYATVTDYRGRSTTSKAVRLTCVTPTPETRKTEEAPPAAERKERVTSVGTALEKEVVQLTNAERATGGCDPLEHDARLRKAAIGHSADMAENDYFDHGSQDGRDMVDRIRATGFGGSAWAENIAMGQRSAAGVVRSWMNSDGHRRNIMNCSYTHIGVGAAKDSNGQIYWTQDFATR